MVIECSDLARIYPNVQLAPGCRVGDFVVIGVPSGRTAIGELPVMIGENSIVRSHSVIYAGVTIGARFQMGHGAMIREHSVLGDDCSVGTGSVVEFRVNIGNGVRLHSKVFVPEYSILEDGCWLGPNVVLTNAKFPLSARAKETLAGVVIRRGAKIGANTTILPGVEIGEGALVGAGSVVTRNVPPSTVAYGSPAKIAGRVSDLLYTDTGLPAYPSES